MPTRGARPGFAAILVGTAVALAACGGGGSGSSDEPTQTPPTSTTSSTRTDSATTTAGGRCAKVSGEDLSSWTGAAFSVEADGDDECTGVADELGPYAVTWSFKPSEGSFAQDVQSESLGLQQEQVDLAGGVSAAVLQGDVSGTRVVRLVAPVGDEVLVVEVLNNDGTTELGFPDLSSVATKVAERYV